MIRSFICFVLLAFALSSCESLKQLSFTDSRQTNGSASNTSLPKTSTSGDKKEIKFLENIETKQTAEPANKSVADKTVERPKTVTEKPNASGGYASNKTNTVEYSSSLQMKYAILMNTEVEAVQNIELFKKIDEWWGTKYCLGGTTSKCIDCSAFMQILFASVYGISLPRTARDQYGFSSKISRTEMKEGDLVFFNTRGGVSHVGLYLQNNKFVHASTNGVTISDLYDPYYIRRLVGVGRVEKAMAGSRSAGSSK
jgi:cell wall-associated NlpC family hydrolase